jgi:hypothetical protein
MHLMDKAYMRYDEGVWRVLRDEPKFLQTGTQSDRPIYDRNIDAPFRPSELSGRLKRFEWLVEGSLHRLEKRGKIKEVRGGWVRKDK